MTVAQKVASCGYSIVQMLVFFKWSLDAMELSSNYKLHIMLAMFFFLSNGQTIINGITLEVDTLCSIK